MRLVERRKLLLRGSNGHPERPGELDADDEPLSPRRRRSTSTCRSLSAACTAPSTGRVTVMPPRVWARVATGWPTYGAARRLGLTQRRNGAKEGTSNGNGLARVVDAVVFSGVVDGLHR